jgi:hypothetical protein
MTAHASLAEADLHECKGASTAVVGKTIIAGGAGAATFKYANPHGGIYYSDVGVGTVITAPAAYTKLAVTTVASGMAIEFTEATTARLTYTGTDTIDCRFICNVGYTQSGATRDGYLQLWKNGVAIAGTEQVLTCETTDKNHFTLVWDQPNIVTNDYFELYMKQAAGNITILSLYMTALGMRG